MRVGGSTPSKRTTNYFVKINRHSLSLGDFFYVLFFYTSYHSAGDFAVSSPLFAKVACCLRHFHPIYVDLSYVYPSYVYLSHALMGLE